MDIALPADIKRQAGCGSTSPTSSIHSAKRPHRIHIPHRLLPEKAHAHRQPVVYYNFKAGKAFTKKKIDQNNSEEKSRLGN